MSVYTIYLVTIFNLLGLKYSCSKYSSILQINYGLILLMHNLPAVRNLERKYSRVASNLEPMGICSLYLLVIHTVVFPIARAIYCGWGLYLISRLKVYEKSRSSVYEAEEMTSNVETLWKIVSAT